MNITINYKQALVLLGGLSAAIDQVSGLNILPPKWGTALMVAGIIVSAFLGKIKEAAATPDPGSQPPPPPPPAA